MLLQNFDRCPPPLQSETGARGKETDSVLLSVWIWSQPGPLLLYLPLYFHLLAFALHLNMLLLSPGSFLNDQLQFNWDCASDLGYNLCCILQFVHPLSRQKSVCWHEPPHPTVTAWARRDPPAPENRQECLIKGQFIAFLLFQMQFKRLFRLHWLIFLAVWSFHWTVGFRFIMRSFMQSEMSKISLPPKKKKKKKQQVYFTSTELKRIFWTTKHANKTKAISLATLPQVVSEVMSTYWLQKRLLISANNSRLNSRCSQRARSKTGKEKKIPPPGTPESWEAVTGNANWKSGQGWKYSIWFNQMGT